VLLSTKREAATYVRLHTHWRREMRVKKVILGEPCVSDEDDD
jgi:hypothetical protein